MNVVCSGCAVTQITEFITLCAFQKPRAALPRRLAVVILLPGKVLVVDPVALPVNGAIQALDPIRLVSGEIPDSLCLVSRAARVYESDQLPNNFLETFQ